jgi:diacylglycerol kinase (ATP)
VRCTLIYNPASGVAHTGREEQVLQAAAVLSAGGNSVAIVSTSYAGSATLQTRETIANGAEVVFACGGDGTIHEVVQGLVCESGRAAGALGIIPLGSANALARHLRISLDPRKAARQQLDGVKRKIPVGVLRQGEQTRYFVVMAGVGPDGALAYRMPRGSKAALGRFAYYSRAARLFLTTRFSPFTVQYREKDSRFVSTQRAVGVMTARVGDLGGLFSGLTDRGASIDELNLRLIVVRPPAIVSLPMWFLLGWLGLRGLNPFVETVYVSRFSCFPHRAFAPYVQADGECTGSAPVEVSLLHRALEILVPNKA